MSRINPFGIRFSFTNDRVKNSNKKHVNYIHEQKKGPATGTPLMWKSLSIAPEERGACHPKRDGEAKIRAATTASMTGHLTTLSGTAIEGRCPCAPRSEQARRHRLLPVCEPHTIAPIPIVIPTSSGTSRGRDTELHYPKRGLHRGRHGGRADGRTDEHGMISWWRDGEELAIGHWHKATRKKFEAFGGAR